MAGKALYDKIWDLHQVDADGDGTGLLYIDRHLKRNVRRWENAKGEIDNHIRPRLGNIALAALKKAHVREMVHAIGEAYPVAANRALARKLPRDTASGLGEANTQS